MVDLSPQGTSLSFRRFNFSSFDIDIAQSGPFSSDLGLPRSLLHTRSWRPNHVSAGQLSGQGAHSFDARPALSSLRFLANHGPANSHIYCVFSSARTHPDEPTLVFGVSGTRRSPRFDTGRNRGSIEQSLNDKRDSLRAIPDSKGIFFRIFSVHDNDQGR
ncbi:hypothetical protein N7535_009016 [Penicillium sp. DV-2018c]|nr:hypothetical protein N7461_003091 [Penicillium sp. DV-2018c]KAJ5560819.1 hypothetical protein N7535_009016 [Penicillium sp. DV-2018c]